MGKAVDEWVILRHGRRQLRGMVDFGLDRGQWDRFDWA
jgi:hypothetical protein